MNVLLTVDEAAERLRVSPQLIRREIREGRLPAIKVSPRNTRISEEALIRLGGQQ